MSDPPGVQPESAPEPGPRACGPAPVTRLAPSPTGALHLGNARTFLITWALARQRGWRVVLRIEDLDGPRIKPGAVEAIVRTLEWLGLTWEGPAFVQSLDLEPARDAMARLAAAGFAYPCDLTRTQIDAAASAPQVGAGEVRFPASLRPPDAGAARAFDQPHRSWRFLTSDEDVVWLDHLAGPQRRRPAESIGDFVIWTQRQTPAYQLAVVVDDARQGVTDVVRGDDLLDSAARQSLLYRALGLAPPGPPAYWHVPLVLGPDGKRLAKRHGDTRVETYRAAAVPAQAVIGLIARWSGIEGPAQPMSAEEFAARLRPDTIPRSPVTMTPEDDAWLRAHA